MILPELKDQTILVTGGANAIGAAIVRAFHKQEARIHFCDVDVDAGRALAESLGAEAFFRKVDLTKEREIRAWLREIRKQKKPIRALINNAARDPRIELAKTSVKQWDALHALNLSRNDVVEKKPPVGN